MDFCKNMSTRPSNSAKIDPYQLSFLKDKLGELVPSLAEIFEGPKLEYFPLEGELVYTGKYTYIDPKIVTPEDEDEAGNLSRSGLDDHDLRRLKLKLEEYWNSKELNLDDSTESIIPDFREARLTRSDILFHRENNTYCLIFRCRNEKISDDDLEKLERAIEHDINIPFEREYVTSDGTPVVTERFNFIFN